ncbi:MAG: alpha/beta fold hydrolase [Acidimicrobiia bacterium]
MELAFRRWPGDGPPVVAVHALTASSLSFGGVAERLAGRRPLLAFDLRGRGDSDKPSGPFGILQHVRDLDLALSRLRVHRPVVVGHSMGAYVVAALAAFRPERVAGVVLLDGGHPHALPPHADPDAVLERILGPVLSRLRLCFRNPDAYLDYWRDLPYFRHVDGRSDWGPWVEAFLADDLADTGDRGFRPKADEMAVRADFADTGDRGFRPKADEMAVRADFADMSRPVAVEARLRVLAEARIPVVVVRAEKGLTPADPPVVSDAALGLIRSILPDVVEHTVADTTHYTILLGRPGASTVADLLVRLGERSGP